MNFNNSVKAFPAGLLQQLRSIDGFDEKSFLAVHEQPAITSVRMHPVKAKLLFENTVPVPWCAEGFYLTDRPVFTLAPTFHAGAYYVQEASSMFLDYMVRQVLPDRENLRVLDLCGAPGGKSTLLASLLGRQSLLISNEVIRSRASILEENVVRWGYTNNWVTSNDPKDFGKLEGYFDLIVVDAPCSGSGLFRKDARALDEWSEANVQLCSQRQRRILADVWNALKEDGILIYATCSYSPEEDEQMLDWLAANHQVVSLEIKYPEEWNIIATRSATRGMHGYRFFPDKIQGEGFFIAAVQKKESVETINYPRFRTMHDKKAHLQSAYLTDAADIVCIPASKESFHAIYQQHEADWLLIHKSVYLRKAGLALGMPSAKEWIPAHDVALSTDRSTSLRLIDLNKEQALKFLKKEETGLTLDERGWFLVAYEGMALGWVKSLGNRFNNYLPKHWRIRMELPGEEWA